MSAPVRVTESDDRVVVTLCRPERRNAIGTATVAALHEVCDALEKEPRFLIITGGNDGVFVGGADIAELVSRDAADGLRGINATVFDRLARAPLPSVAAIDGAALGGGAELAYACDIRIGTPRCSFGQPEANVGIIAGAGATWRLPALVGDGIARDVLFTGRRLEAPEALQHGLLSQVVEPDELLAAAHATVDRMARLSPDALRWMKLVVGSPAAAHPSVDLLAQAHLFGSEDKRQRMQAFLDGRRG